MQLISVPTVAGPTKFTKCAKIVGFSTLRTGRLDADKTYALKVSKLILLIKAPTTHRNLAS
jgi:hypothetical protein